ncbi:uncharacterized protein LOC141902244 [Tubulanus polymorphus]|uniref:uncharacterized protein LOC141902244 n=1 Tax=Tubulanus polymorphus TaxID=672921 RepID=UPI003DA2A02E
METLPESEILANLLPKFNEMRLNGKFCDIELTANGLVVPAHRAFVAASSGSLMSIFSNESADEARLGKYEMLGLTQVQLLDIVDFIYTGSMTRMNLENVAAYREIAVQLDIPNLIAFCDRIRKPTATDDDESEDANIAESIVEKVMAKINLANNDSNSAGNERRTHLVVNDFLKTDYLSSSVVSLPPATVSAIKIEKFVDDNGSGLIEAPSISILDNDDLLDQLVETGDKKADEESDENSIDREFKVFPEVETGGNVEDFWEFRETPAKQTPFKLKVKKRFSCVVCEYATFTSARLEEHSFAVHNVTRGATYTCSLCSFSTVSASRLSGHRYAKHPTTLGHACAKCARTFETRRDLRAHVKSRHTAFLTLVCTRCRKAFRSQVAWRLHANRGCGNCRRISDHAQKKAIVKYTRTHTNSDREPVVNKVCSRCSSLFSVGETRFLLCNITRCRRSARYYCAECDRSSASLEQMREHFHGRHLRDIASCRTCERDFEFVDAYADHVFETHAKKIESDSPLSALKMRSCGQCGFTRYRCRLVQAHMNDSHKTKDGVDLQKPSQLQQVRRKDERAAEKCHICAYVSSSRFALSNHMFAKHGFVEPGKTVYKCEHCSYTSLAKNVIAVHVQTIHLNERPHVCSTCGKAYKTSTMLRGHMETHTPGTHRCTRCAYETNTSMNLRRHERRKHPKGQAYKCHLCPFQTGFLCELNKHHRVVQHKMVHQKYKQEAAAVGSAISTTKNNTVTVLDPKHKCPACPYVTSNSRHLRMHVRRMHLGTPYTCPHCPYRGATQATLDSHLRNVKHVQRHNKYLREEQTDKLPDGVSYEQLLQLGNTPQQQPDRAASAAQTKSPRKKKSKPATTIKKTEDFTDWNRFLQVTDDGTMVTMVTME